MASAGTVRTLKQTERLLQIDTRLGPDALSVRSIHGREAISELFQLDVDLASEDFQIAASSLLSKPATLRIRCGESDERCINGVVSRVTLVPTQPDKLARYQIRIVPAVWFLTQTTNCAIFQDKTTPEIIEAILRKYQIFDYKLRLGGSYQKRDYCVQYRETAFAFISRLMEEEGICYYFAHTGSAHTLILDDSKAPCAPCTLNAQVSWAAAGGSGFASGENSITEWNRTLDVRQKKWTQGRCR